MYKLSSLILFLNLILATLITYADDRMYGVAAMSLANNCLAQNESFTRDAFRKMFLETQEDQKLEILKGLPKEEVERRYQQAIWGLVESPWAVCVRKKQWFSKSLCDDFIPVVMSQSVEKAPELVKKHFNEIQANKAAFDWMEKSFGSKAPSVSCPE